MHIEAGARLDQIVVDHAQCPEIDIIRIVIVRKRKMKVAVKPTVDASAHFLVIDVPYHFLPHFRSIGIAPITLLTDRSFLTKNSYSYPQSSSLIIPKLYMSTLTYLIYTHFLEFQT
jgi:hypothetical protein